MSDSIKAKAIAEQYHYGQIDKAGLPYIEHCLKVGQLASEKGKTEAERQLLCQIGVLHDSLEDTEMTESKLLSLGFDTAVVDTVVILTRLKEETYAVYIDRVCQNQLAIKVKLADIEDHLTPKEDFLLPESLRNRYEKSRTQLLIHLID